MVVANTFGVSPATYYQQPPLWLHRYPGPAHPGSPCPLLKCRNQKRPHFALSVQGCRSSATAPNLSAGNTGSKSARSSYYISSLSRPASHRWPCNSSQVGNTLQRLSCFSGSIRRSPFAGTTDAAGCKSAACPTDGIYGRGEPTYLDLVDMRRPNLRVCLHLLNMSDPIITHPNALSFADLVQLLQRLPHFFPLLLAPVRTVYQKAIDIPLLPVNLVHTVDALLQRLRKAAAGRKDLGRDEDVVALEARLPDCSADFSFVLIKLRRVDVAVSDLQCRSARFDALARGGSVDAEAQTGDPGRAFGHMQLVGDGEFDRHGGSAGQ
jgi:hypothetical protein